MNEETRTIVTVGPEGNILISHSDLLPGTKVEVTVIGLTPKDISRGMDRAEALRELQELNLTRERSERLIAANENLFKAKLD